MNGLGEIKVSVRRGSTRASIRRRNGRWLLIVPPGADMDRVWKWLESVKPSLFARLPEKSLFSFDQPVVLGEGSSARREIAVVSSLRARKGEIFATSGAIHVGEDLDLDDIDVQGTISRLLLRLAYKGAPEILIPRAREIARRVGDEPSEWTISRGHTVLGRCSSRRAIALSCACVFLPPELRDYIVCHELAHLREMNHSARFHALCDAYCSGREKELIAKLHNYKWPVMR